MVPVIPVDGIFIIRSIVSTAIAAVDPVAIMDSDAIYTGIAIDMIAIVRLNGIASISSPFASTMDSINIRANNIIVVCTAIDLTIIASDRNVVTTRTTINIRVIGVSHVNYVMSAITMNLVIIIILFNKIVAITSTDGIICTGTAINCNNIIATSAINPIMNAIANRNMINTIARIQTEVMVIHNIKLQIIRCRCINRASITTCYRHNTISCININSIIMIEIKTTPRRKINCATLTICHNRGIGTT